ncbi:MAG: O-antigen ligase family protein [bacterium]
MQITQITNWINEQSKLLFYSILGIGALGFVASLISSPALGITITLAAIAVWLAIIKPELLVALLALYIPFEPFVLKYIPDDIYIYMRYASELMIYILLGAALLSRLRNQTKLTWGPAGIWLPLFVASLVMSAVLNSVEITTATLGIRQIIRFMLLYLAVINLPIKKDFAKILVWLLIGMAVFQSLIGLSQAVIGSPADSLLIPSEERSFGSVLLTPGTDQFWTGGQRVTATMGRYDQLGTFLSFILLIVVGLLYEHPRFKTKRYLLAGLMVGLGALVLTYSRASWFGFLLGLIAITVFLKRDRKVIGIGLLIVVALAIYPMVTSLVVDDLIDQPDMPIVSRLYEAFSYERWRSEYYGLGRMYFIVETVTKVWPASPIYGFGPGQYGGGATAALGNTAVYDQLGIPFGIFGYTGQIDNNWLSLLGETGLVGVSLFGLILLNLMCYAWKIFKNNQDRMVAGVALGLIGAIVSVIFEAGLGTHFEVRTLGVYLWLLPALLFIMAKPEGKNNEYSPGQ